MVSLGLLIFGCCWLAGVRGVLLGGEKASGRPPAEASLPEPPQAASIFDRALSNSIENCRLSRDPPKAGVVAAAGAVAEAEAEAGIEAGAYEEADVGAYVDAGVGADAEAEVGAEVGANVEVGPCVAIVLTDAKRLISFSGEKYP